MHEKVNVLYDEYEANFLLMNMLICDFFLMLFVNIAATIFLHALLCVISIMLLTSFFYFHFYLHTFFYRSIQNHTSSIRIRCIGMRLYLSVSLPLLTTKQHHQKLSKTESPDSYCSAIPW